VRVTKGGQSLAIDPRLVGQPLPTSRYIIDFTPANITANGLLERSISIR
jgi:hypothetical protein